MDWEEALKIALWPEDRARGKERERVRTHALPGEEPVRAGGNTEGEDGSDGASPSQAGSVIRAKQQPTPRLRRPRGSVLSPQSWVLRVSGGR